MGLTIFEDHAECRIVSYPSYPQLKSFEVIQFNTAAGGIRLLLYGWCAADCCRSSDWRPQYSERTERLAFGGPK